ncbi:MAG: hypothetical protein UY63_C0017G0059 [Parcubacteria group bacterium GW2011_GWA2_51_10]|nr:MAG: hypothetical protein UY63_C0017G0059 [Parcubacteria group bacterium GW2011_GWA2_51_10]
MEPSNTHVERSLILPTAIILVLLAFGVGWFLRSPFLNSGMMQNPAGFFGNASAASEIREGVYRLVGKGPVSDATYEGEVYIARSGSIYDLEWHIAESQIQRGVGILNGNILSVGYIDITEDQIGDAGAVSYVVTSSEVLDGQWTSILGGYLGEEHLIWMSPLPESIR